MKKIVLLLSFLSIFCLSSCKEKFSYEGIISQLRQTSLFYENDEFSIIAHPEKCENPQVDDGAIGTIENRICFKLQLKTKTYENCKLEFSINGKTYKANFNYQPLSKFLYCTVLVEFLPIQNLYLKIDLDDKNIGVNLFSLKNNTTLTHQKIIENLFVSDEFVKEFITNQNGELKMRFIDNDGYDYWYLGFVDAKKTTSYLIDGESGEVLAIKQ